MLQISISKRPPYVQLLERALWICVSFRDCKFIIVIKVMA